ncbi:MAG: SDR family NAD(P)-dependent oxidoreductase [Bradymonadaceae bacterium]
MTDIRSRHVLITGAAGGIGSAMAREFAEAGARLSLVDIDADGLESTAQSILSPVEPPETFVCDLSDREAIDELIDAVHDGFGAVDLLVNNAGMVCGGRYDEIDDEADEALLDVNVRAVHRLTKGFLGDVKSGGGHLVQVASAAGLLGVPYQAAYSASKWFVVGLSEALRQELKQEGYGDVGVTVVCPSLVDTEMFEGSEPPLLTSTLQPEFVAGRVVEAVRQDEPYVKEPFMVKTLPVLQALLPPEALDFLADLLGATDIMDDWQGH